MNRESIFFTDGSTAIAPNTALWRATTFHLPSGTSLVEESTPSLDQLVELVVVHLALRKRPIMDPHFHQLLAVANGLADCWVNS